MRSTVAIRLLAPVIVAPVLWAQAERGGPYLPDETAGIDNIARTLISTFNRVDVPALKR